MGFVLVTGGAGFIGSHLVDALIKRGRSVRVIDNFSTGRKENLKEHLNDVDLIKADICDFSAVKEAVDGVSAVYHLAAVSSVPMSVDNPLPTFESNLKGTWNVLEACRFAHVKRFVFTSSASVYGAADKIPFKESMLLLGSSPYAASKLIGEQMCDLYRRLYGLETVALRLFSVYGPRQNPRSQYANVIPNFTTRLLHGKQPTIYGTGRQTRDFVFVGDVIRAFLAAGRLKKAAGKVINFGSGKQTSVKELLRMIQKSLGTDIPPKFEPLKPGDDPRTLADTTMAKKLLNLTSLTPFQYGLNRTLVWFKENEMSPV